MKLELQRRSFSTPGAQSARQAWAERQSVLLRLTDGSGQSGLGEASPLPGYSPDGLDEVEAALARLAPDAVSAALQQMPARAALRAVSQLVPARLPSARMALETAALDLLGRARGESATALLGVPASAQRTLAQLLGPASSPRLLADAEQAVRAGFRHLKLKLGGPGQLAAELAGVAALRKQFGAGVSLRVDANRALSASEVASAWSTLQPLGIEIFEEPGHTPEHLLGELPLGLDESLQGASEDEADAAMRRLKARCLVLKPTALGGLDHCWRLAERARDQGVDVVVSHCFDGPLAFRAAAALALALPRGLAQGLAPHAALGGWPDTALPVSGATLLPWREPGLGELGSLWSG